MKKTILPILLLILCSCDFAAKMKARQEKEDKEIEAFAHKTFVNIYKKWHYESFEDGGATYFQASIVSPDIADFHPPDEDSHLTLQIQEESGEVTVALIISGGSFQKIGKSSVATISFDGEEKQEHELSEAADADSTIRLLGNEADLVSKLKKAKTVEITCEFNRQDAHTFKFDVAGLKWNR